MFLQYRDLKLIQTNNRPNQDNAEILDGKYDNSETPLSYEDRMAKIFSDWQQGDILVIADSPLKHPKLQGDTLVEMTREEVCESGDLSVLDIGEVYQEGAIIKKEKPQGVKIEWIYPNWIETASDDEITEYIGKNVTKLLYEVLSIGCEVTVSGEKHQQSLSDEKRKALNERISGFKLAEELGSPITHVAWPFKDDGTDTVVMTTDETTGKLYVCMPKNIKINTVNDTTVTDNFVLATNVDTRNKLDNLIKIIKKDTDSTYIEYDSGLKVYYGRAYILGSSTVNSYYTVDYPTEFSQVINMETSVIRNTNLSTQQFPITVLFGLTSSGFCYRDIERQAGAGYVVDYTLIGY